MTAVTFKLDKDGRHVWWRHDCTDPIKAEHGSRLRIREETMLPQPTWVVVQREPLTLQPSIICTACGCHGNIVAGKWVTA